MKLNNKIPNVFHYIWIGEQPQPDCMKQNIARLKKMYPTFEIKIWTEKELDINECKYAKLAYKLKKYAFVSDYFRTKILYEEGGIYLDVDMEPLQDIFDSLFTHKLILGFEYSKLVGTGIIAAAPKQDLVKYVLDFYLKFDKLTDKNFDFPINNIIWTWLLYKQYNLKLNDHNQELRQGIKIFNHNVFSCLKPNKNSRFIHNHNLSWTTNLFKIFWCLWTLRFVQKFQIILSPILMSVTRSWFRDQERLLKYLNKIN